MGHIRLHAEDVADEVPSLEPGGYCSCGECIAKFAPRIEVRLRRTQDVDSRGLPALNDDGTPRMVLGATQPITAQYME